MESLMCQIEKMMNHQLGGKMNKDVFRFQYFERGTKKKIGLIIFLTLLTNTKLLILLILTVCRMCIIYELNKRLTTFTVSLVIQRLSVA